MIIQPPPKSLLQWLKLILAVAGFICFVIYALQTQSLENVGWAIIILLWILESIIPDEKEKKNDGL